VGVVLEVEANTGKFDFDLDTGSFEYIFVADAASL
jgi:hypothetical protein